jgi:hypothetical protein
MAVMSDTLLRIGGLRFPRAPLRQRFLFSDLGSGASDAIDITGFPTNAIYLGTSVEIDTAFAGEADLAMQIGFTGGDTDALVGSTNLNAVAAGWLAITAGVVHAGTFAADWVTDNLAILFTATELDDVTAGGLTVHIHYALPTLQTA